MLRAFARALIGCHVDMPSSRNKKKKNSMPLLAHKEKLKEDLSRGNSISFVRFFFSFLCFWLSEYFVCLFLFEKIGMFPL